MGQKTRWKTKAPEPQRTISWSYKDWTDVKLEPDPHTILSLTKTFERHAKSFLVKQPNIRNENMLVGLPSVRPTL